MKKFFTLLVALVASISTLLAADYIVIRVGKNIAMPVKVHTSNGTYTITTYETRINGNISVNSAYDANGQQIMVQGSVSGGTNQATVRYYDLTQTYSSSSSNYSSSSGSSYSSSSVSSSVRSSGSNFYSNAMSAASSMMFVSGDGLPYFGVEVGYSRFCTYFVRPRLALGESGGFLLYGGVGKDDVFKKHGGSEEVYWHVGLGSYVSDEVNTIETGITLGTNPMCNTSEYDDPDIYGGWGFVLDARYSFTIPGTLFSFYAGAGIGVGWTERGSAQFIYDLHAGVSVKLFSDWW
ncbi:MAG: hypothetical protein IKL67_02525 [Tidjanibacter sp.]|nr:hypothetical protein [Tidjanibacter sp.]